MIHGGGEGRHQSGRRTCRVHVGSEGEHGLPVAPRSPRGHALLLEGAVQCASESRTSDAQGHPGRGTTEAPVARRMRADVCKRSILKAARKAFSETGDLNGTTIKIIAQHAEISEGVIYRHFESKDQLFFEAVVEPLREAVDSLVVAAETIDRDEPLTPSASARQVRTVSTVSSFRPSRRSSPFWVVLFGDPRTARRFYNENFAVAMDRLGDVWLQVESRYGHTFVAPDITARGSDGHRAHPRSRELLQQELRLGPGDHHRQRRMHTRLLPTGA